MVDLTAKRDKYHECKWSRWSHMDQRSRYSYLHEWIHRGELFVVWDAENRRALPNMFIERQPTQPKVTHTAVSW